MSSYLAFRRICNGDPAPTPDKRLATLRARLAIKGIVLNDLEGDDGTFIYVVTQGHFTKQFQTIEELMTWTDMVTGVKAQVDH